MKKIIYFLLLIFPVGSFGQTWIISQQFKCDDDLRILDIKKDNNDNFYAAGIFKGTFQGITSEGNYDIFLAKVNPSFNIEWVQTVGSSLMEFDPRLTIDNDDNIFLVGAFQDSCVFDNNYLKSDGNYDIFLSKYNSSGELNWANKIATYPSQQSPTDIDVDMNNDLIITGHYTDSIFIYDQSIVSSGKNNFFAKFDTSGVKIWIKNVSGSSAASRINNVKVYQNEYYFNGYFRDDMNFDLETITSNVAGKQDLFLYKTDSDGDGMWIRRTYGDNLDATGSIAGDAYGNVYFTGYYQSSTFSADSTESLIANQVLNHVNDFDIFVLKYNKSGTLQLNKHFGNDGRDFGVDLSLSNDILYMSGYFSDSINFNGDTLTTTGTLDRDMFLASFDLNLNPYNGIKLGGDDNNDLAAGSIVLNTGVVVMSGYFQSTILPVGDSTYTNTNPGLRDGVVAKYYAPLSAAFTKITRPTCNSQSNGELIVTPKFGEKPYTYLWNIGGTDSTATGLSAGTYTVTVTDALDSIDVAQYILTEPDAFIFNPDITQVTTCSDSEEGAIDLNVTGGNGGNEYYWVGEGTVLEAEDQSGLGIGEYKVTVTDENSCTGDTAIYINGPDTMRFGNSSIVQHYLGVGSEGEIDLEITGGTGTPSAYGASWTGPDGYTNNIQDINTLNPGTYNVTVTDENLCNADTSFIIINQFEFSSYIESKKDACNGVSNGRATVNYYSPVGHTNITYLWDSNAGDQITATANNLTGIGAGIKYYVTVTDTDEEPDVSIVDSVIIYELSYNLSGSLSGSTTAVYCKGDEDGLINLTITEDGTEPYSFNWSNGKTTEDINGLGAGFYSVTVTDDMECSFSITNYEITEPEFDLSVSISLGNEPSCNGLIDGELLANAGGGNGTYSYEWSDPGHQTSAIANGLGAGFYIVTVSDYKGCEATDNHNLTEPEVITINSENTTDASGSSVSDGSVTVSATGGTGVLDYTLNPGNINNSTGVFESLLPGDYTVDVTDDNLCGPVTSSTLSVSSPDGIDDYFSDERIRIYPNPTSGRLFIKTEYEGDFVIQLVNVSGGIVYAKNLNLFGEENLKEINVANYPKGIYFIRLYNKEVSINRKIIIQ